MKSLLSVGAGEVDGFLIKSTRFGASSIHLNRFWPSPTQSRFSRWHLGQGGTTAEHYDALSLIPNKHLAR